MADYTTAPSVSISDYFRNIVQNPQVGTGQAPPLQLSATPASLQQAPVPPPLSAEQIGAPFKQMEANLGQMQAPPPHAMPPSVNPWGAFGASLAANLGSAFTHNPMFAQTVQAQLEQNRQRQQAIMDENYRNNVMFNQERQNRLFSIRGQALEAQLNEAMRTNDQERAATIAQNLQKLEMENRLQQMKQQAQLWQQTQGATKERVAEIGAAGKIGAAEETSKGRVEAAQARQQQQSMFKMKDYQNNLAAIQKMTDKQVGDQAPVFTIGNIQIGGTHGVNKAQLLEAAHAAAFRAAEAGGAEPGVGEAAKRGLLLSIKHRLGLDASSAAGKATLTGELNKYGIFTEEQKKQMAAQQKSSGAENVPNQ